jgi:hypothetical protein
MGLPVAMCAPCTAENPKQQLVLSWSRIVGVPSLVGVNFADAAAAIRA